MTSRHQTNIALQRFRPSLPRKNPEAKRTLTRRRSSRRKRTGRACDACSVTLVLICICIAALLPFRLDAFHQPQNARSHDRVSAVVLAESDSMAQLRRCLPSGKSEFSALDAQYARVAVLGVTGTTLSSAIVAYGFARLKFRGRNCPVRADAFHHDAAVPRDDGSAFFAVPLARGSHRHRVARNFQTALGARCGSDRRSIFSCCGNSS